MLFKTDKNVYSKQYRKKRFYTISLKTNMISSLSLISTYMHTEKYKYVQVEINWDIFKYL